MVDDGGSSSSGRSGSSSSSSGSSSRSNASRRSGGTASRRSGGTASSSSSVQSDESVSDIREADAVFPRNSVITGMLGYAKISTACKMPIDYLVRKEVVTIGRMGFDADCQIRSDTRTLSRNHARLFWDAEKKMWAIQCLSKKSAILVDGCSIVFDSPPVYLRSKTLVEMGDVAFFFLLSGNPCIITGDLERTEQLVLEMRTNRKRKRAGYGSGLTTSSSKKIKPSRSSSPVTRSQDSGRKGKNKSTAADIETDDSSSNEGAGEIEGEDDMEIEEDEIRPAVEPKPEPVKREEIEYDTVDQKESESRSSGMSPRRDSRDRSPEPEPVLESERESKQEPVTPQAQLSSFEEEKVKSSIKKRKREVPANPGQYREEWYKKEKTDFSRALNAFGAEPIRDEDGEIIEYDWTKFRRIAELPKKSDDQLQEYYERTMADVEALLEEEDREKRTKGPRTKHKPGCACIVCMNTRKSRQKKREENNGEEAVACMPVEEDEAAVKNTGRAGDRLVGLVTAQKLRVRFSIHDALRMVDSEAGRAIIEKYSGMTADAHLPNWWISGQHDRTLLLAAREHGVGMWKEIWNDRSIEDFAVISDEYGDNMEWPTPQSAMKRLRDVANAINAEIRRLKKKELRRASEVDKGLTPRGGRAKSKKTDGPTKRKSKPKPEVKTYDEPAGTRMQSDGTRSKESSRHGSDAEPEMHYGTESRFDAEDEEVEIEVDDDDDLVVEEEYDEEPVPFAPESATARPLDAEEEVERKVQYETSSESESE